MLQHIRGHVLTNNLRLRAAGLRDASPLQPKLWLPHQNAFCTSIPLWSQARESLKPYYVTTPIFYVNAAPHVGHLYSMILADIFKRWHELKGEKAILCTGTDEHGMKIQQAADKARSDPKTFCDKGADIFKVSKDELQAFCEAEQEQDLAAEANVSTEHFIRTTDPEHREAVQYAWTLLEERGYIYLDKHEGWYSVSDETFYPQSAVQLTIDPSTGRKIMSSVETGKEVEWTSEVNYKFRLSSFKNQLLSFYRRTPRFIRPLQRMDHVVQEVTTGLEDLSISRPRKRLNWGILVPTDHTQTIYVWLDALINYVTKAGFPWAPGAKNAGGWPADVQIIGKDIVRFHCIYWPAFLMALDLPFPKNILTHAHWTLGKEKMAKSTGNVVNPFFAINRFGTDVMRFYLAHDGGIDKDADYSNEYIIDRYKKALQSGMGNLASRLTRGKGWDVREAVRTSVSQSKPPGLDASFNDHGALLAQTSYRFAEKMDDLDIRGAIPVVMHMIYKTNGFMQASEPWSLAKTIKEFHNADSPQNAPTRKQLEEKKQMKEKMLRIVFQGVESLRIAGILLQPVMPTKMDQLLDMLGVKKENRTFEMAKFCADREYGDSFVDLGKGHVGALFPPLLSEY